MIMLLPFKRTLQLLLVVANLSVGFVAAEDAAETKLSEEDAKRIQAIWDRQGSDQIETADIVFQWKVVGPKWVKPLTKKEVFIQIQNFDINDKFALEKFIKSVSTADLPGKPGGKEIHLMVKGDRIFEQDYYISQAVNGGEVVRAMRPPNSKHAQIDIYNLGESPYFINQLKDISIDPPRKFLKPFMDKTINVTHRHGDEYGLSTPLNEKGMQVAFSFSKKTGDIYERMIATPKNTQWRVARFYEKVQNGPEAISFPRLKLDFEFNERGKLLRMYVRILKSIQLNVQIPDDRFELHVDEHDVVVDSRRSRAKPRVFRSRAFDNAVDASPLSPLLPPVPVPLSEW